MKLIRTFQIVGYFACFFVLSLTSSTVLAYDNSCPATGRWPVGCTPSLQPSSPVSWKPVQGNPCPATGGWPAGCTPNLQPSSPIPSEPSPQENDPCQQTLTYTGSGSSVVDLSDRQRCMAIMEISVTQPNDNFIVWTKNAQGENIDLVANEIATNWRGEVLVDRQRQENIRYIEVDSSGSWTITFRPTSEADQLQRPGSLSGTQNTILLVSGGGIIDISYQGSSNFIVWVYDGAGRSVDLLVNEIDSWSGQVVMPSSARFMEITADSGRWSLNHR